MEVNSTLLGNGSNKRRAAGEQKAMRTFRLGGREDEKSSEERIPLKVWSILTTKSGIAMKSGEEVKIGLVKDGSAKETKHVGGGIFSHQKKARTKFLQLDQSKGKKNYASYMKGVDKFITGCGGLS